jgi:hypothetical protein
VATAATAAAANEAKAALCVDGCRSIGIGSDMVLCSESCRATVSGAAADTVAEDDATADVAEGARAGAAAGRAADAETAAGAATDFGAGAAAEEEEARVFDTVRIRCLAREPESASSSLPFWDG